MFGVERGDDASVGMGREELPDTRDVATGTDLAESVSRRDGLSDLQVVEDNTTQHGGEFGIDLPHQQGAARLDNRKLPGLLRNTLEEIQRVLGVAITHVCCTQIGVVEPCVDIGHASSFRNAGMTQLV